MKYRVLFVDDEQLVLDGLQRMLRSMRDVWEMAFVDSAAKALQLLDEKPYHVLVSDMRMPAMNGAELMQAVAKRHPDTIRIILSGHADRDLISQCLGVTHQYLSKPCDPEVLKNLINNACRLGGDISSERVKEMLGRIDRLPSMPNLYRALSSALASEKVSSIELGQIVSQDIAMTAKILKLVNSAFFGLRRELASATEAVTYLGTETIRSLVLANGIFDGVGKLGTKNLKIEQIWSHSLSVARGAKGIAQVLSRAEKIHDLAFTGGLLHDAGILVLASGFPESYDEVLDTMTRERIYLPMAEHQVFGVDHAEVGAYLMQLWGLPLPVVECIRRHHQPEMIDVEQNIPLIAVHLADALPVSAHHSPMPEHCVPHASLLAHPIVSSRMKEIQSALELALTGNPMDIGVLP
ncbi:MAG TPA: response regulator [Holophaga sp.]|jgi:putative nucleotidyltransferase with HDIG domain|nr:response regulator [Holophaga sp.]